MINQKLQDFEEEVKPIGNVVTEATLDVYNTVVQRFLPTPAKIHYLFNLRDISKVSVGLSPCFDWLILLSISFLK
jgi:dynein heavy chain